MTVSTDKKEKKPKKKGPIRWGAIVPILVLLLGFFLYGKYAFDSHLRKAIIYGLEMANGAEVNLRSASLSFLKGKLTLIELQVTDKENPTHNLIAVGKIDFNLNTYELLKAKFIVEKSEVTNIQWANKRKKPGRIIMTPPPAPGEGPGTIAQLEDSTLKTMQQNFKGNALGDAANVLSGEKSTKDQINDIKGELITEKKIKELEAELKGKEDQYKKLVNSIKSQEDLKKIKNQVNDFKWNKKDPIGSLKKVNTFIKTTKSTVKKYKEEIKNVERDIKIVKNVSSNIDEWIEEDMKNLQSRAGIPELNPEELAFSLFGNYFGTKVASFRKYSEMAKEYMPPPKEERKENTLIPTKRGEGKNFLFPKIGENPKFWIKDILVSSTAGKSEYGGDLSGHILNITSSQKLIGKPTTLDIKGNFPKQRIEGVQIKGVLDHMTKNQKQEIEVSVGSYPFPSKNLSKSKDLSLELESSPANLTFKAVNQGEMANVGLVTNVSKPKFNVNAEKKLVKEIVQNSLDGMRNLNIRADARGTWKNLMWKFRSNLGDQLTQGFKKELDNRIKDAKRKLKEKLLAKIEPQKQAYLGKAKSLEKDLKEQLNKQKGQADEEVKQMLAKLKGQQKNSVKKNTKKLKSKAKKLFKKLF
ncbi:MAG: TIGR03545 family protein [Halobacteriovoraceae bacterium]|nr:TIGR03545 family protein [Halobacteriovoraceae bacterium]